MGAHGSTIVRTSVQADLGKDSETRTFDEDGMPVQETILDEAFVARVRTAYESLDLTNVTFNDIVPTVIIELIKPEGAELVSIKAVERALTHLMDAGDIVLPEFAEMASV